MKRPICCVCKQKIDFESDVQYILTECEYKLFHFSCSDNIDTMEIGMKKLFGNFAPTRLTEKLLGYIRAEAF